MSCEITGCLSESAARGLCQNHYSQDWRARHPQRAKATALRSRRKRRTTRPWYSILQSTRQRANNAGLSWELSERWARENYSATCSITGILFVKGTRGFQPFSASVDRIDNAQGYTPGNCRFILNCINSFKGSMSETDMWRVVAAMAAKKGDA